MDIDEILLREWEEDASFPELSDYSMDFATASSLQSQYASSTDFSSTNKEGNQKNESFLRSLDEDLDYAFALSLQTQYEEELNVNTVIDLKKNNINVAKASKPLSIVDEQWELIDPHPDIHGMFLAFNTKYFDGKLLGVEVRWSPRMTQCAGMCCYEGRGGLCSVRLSVPLLKLRPRRDLVETLLHEMIHAYLFVTHNNKDRNGHGPEFLSHMNRINKETGTRISVYHSFHDEVELYRTHWWKCDGPCKGRGPFYGIVKRAMNRAPGPNDNWWDKHQTSCGGKFVKIREPENYKKGVKRKPADSKRKEPLSNTIKSFDTLKSSSNKSNFAKPLMTKSSNISTITSVLAKEENVVPVRSKLLNKNFIPFGGGGHKLGGSSKNSSPPSYLSKSKETKPLCEPKTVFSSSSSESPQSNPLSRWAKFPRLANATKMENTDSLPSTSQKPEISPGKLAPRDFIPSISRKRKMSPKKFIQSSMEKFLSPKKEAVLQSNSMIAVKPEIMELDDSGSGGSKVTCPICSLLVKNIDINFHLDECLKN